MPLHAGGAQHLVRATMQGIEDGLDPARFVRVHRSAIVQVRSVIGLEPGPRANEELVLSDGTRLSIGRRYRASALPRFGFGA